VPVLVLALFSAQMGKWRWINLSEARTINIGTNKQQSKSIGMATLLRR
jgi:hypothetical protein